jgi:Uma2 family endonuclease
MVSWEYSQTSWSPGARWGRNCCGTPLLVVEVLSRGTTVTDLHLKRGLYESRLVEHCWIVDPVGPSVEALRLVDGGYVIAAKGGCRAAVRG